MWMYVRMYYIVTHTYIDNTIKCYLLCTDAAVKNGTMLPVCMRTSMNTHIYAQIHIHVFIGCF